MPAENPLVDIVAAEALLLRLLAVEGVTGQEAAIAQAVSEELQQAGLPASAIRFDDAHTRISLPTETGNLYAELPGTRPGPHLLFSTHLDTVALCAGAKVKREGDRLVTDGTTALGGDNRTGCAVLVTLVKTLLAHRLPHPPITLLFTVREESGLHGARELKPEDLGGAAMGFNVDGRLAGEITIGAAGQEAWEVELRGQAAHSGLAPEQGISSTLVAALALGEGFRGGWWGKIEKPGGKGTSNVGFFGGREGRAAGDATNVVTDFAYLKGESRSHDEKFVKVITDGWEQAFAAAAAAAPNAKGEQAAVQFSRHVAFPPFRAAEDAPIVQRAVRAVESLGLKPTFRISNGGQDANWITRHGVPTITIGAGQDEIHTVRESVNLAEFAAGCRLAAALATMAE
ncbi:MAG: M20/M25/M40 family metallo-hydrolase [Limisphaerales bacterium]